MTASRQRTYQQRNQAKGRCVKCARPRVNKNHCELHRLYDLAYQANRRAMRRAEKALRPLADTK